MTILYDPATMNALYDELKTNGSKIQGEIQELNDAANLFRQNLSGDQAISNFDNANKNVNTELDDTLSKLDQLAAEVENALSRALEADGRVGDGFSAF
ncbi:type VII secretion protein EsxR [Nocardia asteroides]|uniref:type VII secretion protein EsxR n=1 Tax=Nocardia asteroides TaxID=1824 RepID=UPI001E410831|nr:type VII secretion protein EsxR [Nocardia asteroides]UGT60008.1 type VII secretion protein EsxR [Nocardia asteroides]